jgi:polysaccharide biosynthesis transport protein
MTNNRNDETRSPVPQPARNQLLKTRETLPRPVARVPLGAKSSSAGKEISIHDLLRLLFSYWRLIAFTLACSVLIGVIYCLFATRMYSATTTIEIAGYAPLLPGAEVESSYSQQTKDQNYMKTQVAKLVRLSVANEVLGHDNLGSEVEDYFDDRRSWIGSLVRWTTSWFRSRSRDNKAIERYDYEESFLHQYLDLIDIEPIYATSLVEVSATTADPKLSQKIADTHAEGFINYIREERHRNIMANLQFLEKQGDELQKKITDAEKKLADYAEQNELVALTKKESIVLQEITDLTKLLSDATGRRIRSESMFQEIKDASHLDSTALDDESIRLLRVSLKEAEAEYAELNQKVTPAYPTMVELKAKIDTLKESIEQQRKQALNSLESQFKTDLETEKRLLEQIEGKKKIANETSKKLVQYNIMEREYESLKDLYQVVLRQLKESQLSSASSGTNISISDYAVLPQGYSRPRIAVVIALSLCFGLMLGIAIAFLRSYFDSTLKNLDDVYSELGLPTLGVIPSLDQGKRKEAGEEADRKLLPSPVELTKPGGLKKLAESRLFETLSNQLKICQGKLPRNFRDAPDPVAEFITVHTPQAFASEAFRTIRTGLLLSSVDNPPRIVMATSSRKGEGKTTFISNLAVTLAQASYKTVLLDADVRQRDLYRRFDIPSDQEGLVDYLAGQVSLNEIINSTVVENLFVIPTGFLVPNPSELIGSRKMAEFIQFLAEKYDYVLLDAPPVLPVADSLMLSQVVDGVIFVVRSQSTEKRLAQEATRRLEQVNAPLLGVVVNDVSMSQSSEYGYNDPYSSAYYVVPEEGSEHFRAFGG